MSMVLDLNPKRVNVSLQCVPLAKISAKKETRTFLFSKHCYGHQAGVLVLPEVCCITLERGSLGKPTKLGLLTDWQRLESTGMKG